MLIDGKRACASVKNPAHIRGMDLYRSLMVFGLLIALGLGGCGIKPKTLSAPEEADPKAYPKTYPTAK